MFRKKEERSNDAIIGLKPCNYAFQEEMLHCFCKKNCRGQIKKKMRWSPQMLKGDILYHQV